MAAFAHIGRVGGFAVALGIGVAVSLAGSALASANPADSSPPPGSGASNHTAAGAGASRPPARTRSSRAAAARSVSGSTTAGGVVAQPASAGIDSVPSASPGSDPPAPVASALPWVALAAARRQDVQTVTTARAAAMSAATVTAGHQLRANADTGSSQGSNGPSLPTFSFTVQWGTEVRSFQEISGLDAESQPIEYRPSNSPVFSVIKMPGLVKYGSVTMTTSALKSDTEFWAWLDKFKMNNTKRTPITINLLDETGEAVTAWKLSDAWPTKISVTELNAENSQVTIKISHTGLTEIAPTLLGTKAAVIPAAASSKRRRR